MYEVFFVIAVLVTAVYLCLRKRRRRLEAAAALANAEAINGDGMVAVRIDGDWHLFARAAVPPGHQQMEVPLGPVVASPLASEKPALLVAQPDGKISVAVEVANAKAETADEQAPSRAVHSDPAWMPATMQRRQASLSERRWRSCLSDC